MPSLFLFQPGSRAAGLSVLVHLLALFALPGLARQENPPPLLATLRLQVAAAEQGAAVAVKVLPAKSLPQPVPDPEPHPARPRNADAPPASPAHPPKQTKALPSTPVLAAAAAMPAVVPAASEPVAALSPAAPSTVAEAVAAPVRSSATAAITAAATGAATVPPTANADALASYRRQLSDLFASKHDYPRLAAMRGWEGEVRLRLRVARRGNVLGVQLDHSSGYEVLDRHALAMLEGHGDLPPLPETLDAREIQLVLPINYRLRRTT